MEMGRDSQGRWRWMGSCARSTEPLHSTSLTPAGQWFLAGSDRFCRFLSQQQAVGARALLFFLKLQEDNKIRIDTLSNILAHTHAFVYCVFDDNITLSRA